MLSKSEALYYQPESINSLDGARCGICWKFNSVDNLCVEVDGSISGKRGVCGLYIHGDPVGNSFNVTPARKVTKDEAGYTENGPTHCANCDEMIIRGLYTQSRCRKVSGMIEGRGCCNVWEPDAR